LYFTLLIGNIKHRLYSKTVNTFT